MRMVVEEMGNLVGIKLNKKKRIETTGLLLCEDLGR
jgi:hypothetical protein